MGQSLLRKAEASVPVGAADSAPEGATRGSQVEHYVPALDHSEQRDLPAGVAMTSNQIQLERELEEARARAGVAIGGIHSV